MNQQRTEEQIEHAKRLMDQLDALLLSNALSQKEYDILAKALERIIARYRVPLREKPKMKPEAFVVWATNHAPMYQTHLRLAREHAPYATWIRHIIETLIPEYRRDLHEPHESLSAYETLMVATKLKEYYAEHVAYLAEG